MPTKTAPLALYVLQLERQTGVTMMLVELDHAPSCEEQRRFWQEYDDHDPTDANEVLRLIKIDPLKQREFEAITWGSRKRALRKAKESTK